MAAAPSVTCTSLAASSKISCPYEAKNSKACESAGLETFRLSPGGETRLGGTGGGDLNGGEAGLGGTGGGDLNGGEEGAGEVGTTLSGAVCDETQESNDAWPVG